MVLNNIPSTRNRCIHATVRAPNPLGLCTPTLNIQTFITGPLSLVHYHWTINIGPLSLDHYRWTVIGGPLSSDHCQLTDHYKRTIINGPLSLDHCYWIIIIGPLSLDPYHGTHLKLHKTVCVGPMPCQQKPSPYSDSAARSPTAHILASTDPGCHSTAHHHHSRIFTTSQPYA